MSHPPFIFFGSPDIAVVSLDSLKNAGFVPSAIITAPDAPRGRGLILAAPPAKEWATRNNVPVLQPKQLSDPDCISSIKKLSPEFCVVVAYGKIIPQTILDIPLHGTLNMHPSLLPRHRGPSPIESQILHEKTPAQVGVSIMLLDEKMDHGPVLTKRTIEHEDVQWPVSARALRPLLARLGADTLAETLPLYLSGSLKPTPQDDAQATYCTMVRKEDAHIELTEDPRVNYLKILAYDIWPRAFFFTEKKGKRTRVVITQARFENETLIIERVIPEGRKEMTYVEFLS